MSLVLVIGERPERAHALSERLGICGVDALPCDRDWKLAVRSLTSHSVSLIVLDVDSQPDTQEFFRTIRDITDMPIIARGAATNYEQQIWYLENGAADYIGRTVSAQVLAARVQAILRSGRSPGQTVGIIRIGVVAIDVDSHSVVKDGVPVSLTPIEFRLLTALAENAGRACSRDELLRRVWGEDFEDCSHYLRLYIAYLRGKLEDNPHRPQMLLTEWGYGYRLVPLERSRAPARVRAAVRMPAS